MWMSTGLAAVFCSKSKVACQQWRYFPTSCFMTQNRQTRMHARLSRGFVAASWHLKNMTDREGERKLEDRTLLHQFPNRDMKTR